MEQRIFIVMGVSGSGKSTIGQLLAAEAKIPFFDGDDYHPEANIDKMSKGLPLNDQDRQGWLERLNALARSQTNGAVIACSALKESYRQILAAEQPLRMEWIYLDGSFETIAARLKARAGHFMPSSLLKSQFETLEVPEDAIRVSIEEEPAEILRQILIAIN